MMKKVPKRRFKRFLNAGDWEQRKLGEIASINPRTELPNSFKYVDLESVIGTNLIGCKKIEKENAPSRAQRLASFGDIFYQTVRPYQRNNYLFEKDDDDVVFSTGYAQLRSELDSYFLFTLVQTDSFVSKVLDHCTGTSYPAINSSELDKILISVPQNKLESHQIGTIFRVLDNLITLHQRKLEKLQATKKALLYELFPIENSRRPKRRFKGFTDDWEQRKLGELGKARSGVGFPDKEQGGKIGIPFLKVSDMNLIGNENEITVANNYVTETQIKIHNWMPIERVPAIFFAKVGAAVMLNRKRLCLVPFLLDNNTMAYSLDLTKWDTNFAKTLFETINLPSLVQVGALPSYNTGDIEALHLRLPSISEQVQIGLFFKYIDVLITLHQRKLEKLKNLKAAYLNEMFV